LLVAKQLARSRGLRDVVSNVSLYVARGEAVALLGPNGAGKTTTFQMIVGVITPDRGSILVDDEDVTLLPIFERARRGLNYLPQAPSLFSNLTVEQNILLVLEAQPLDPEKIGHFSAVLLDRFGLTHVRHQSASRISGGERRRCEIARTIAARPSFILLDEPFAGIDPIAIGEIRHLIRMLTERGIGVLITDHNVTETLVSVDRAYIIDSGRIFAEGTPNDIVQNSTVQKVYLNRESNR
jgi:lipopolysaccharide export system ATP-binding protein